MSEKPLDLEKIERSIVLWSGTGKMVLAEIEWRLRALIGRVRELEVLVDALLVADPSAGEIAMMDRIKELEAENILLAENVWDSPATHIVLERYGKDLKGAVEKIKELETELAEARNPLVYAPAMRMLASRVKELEAKNTRLGDALKLKDMLLDVIDAEASSCMWCAVVLNGVDDAEHYSSCAWLSARKAGNETDKGVV